MANVVNEGRRKLVIAYNDALQTLRNQFEHHIQGEHSCDFDISDEMGTVATGHIDLMITGFMTTIRISKLVLAGEEHNEVFEYRTIRTLQQFDALLTSIVTYQSQRSIEELKLELSQLDSTSENVSHLVFCVDKLLDAKSGSKAKKVRAVRFTLTSALSATLAAAETNESVVTIQEMRIIRDMTLFAISLDETYHLGVRESIEREVLADQS